MIYWILQASVYFVLLFGLYHFLLKQLGYFHVNRIYLLSILPLSFYLPSISIETYYLHQLGWLSHSSAAISESLGKLASDEIVKDQLTETGLLTDWIVWIYVAIAMFLLLRLMRSLIYLFDINRRTQQLSINGRVYRLTAIAEPAFSFFNQIYLHPNYAEAANGRDYILEHENVHTRQWHTLDILLTEIMKVVCWFHPLVYRLLSEIKLNHEFLADAGVCRTASKRDYFQFLLSYSEQRNFSPVVNQFAAHPLKRRALSANLRRHFGLKHLLTMLFVVPVFGAVISAFSAGQYKSEKVTLDYEQKKSEHTHIHINSKSEIISFHEGKYGTIATIK